MISVTITGTVPEVNTDMSERMVKVAEIAKRAIQTNFMMGGRPHAWEPVKPPRFGTPLIATGALYASIRSDSGPDWAEVAAGGNFGDVRIPMALFGKGWGEFTMTGRNLAARLPSRPAMILTEHDLTQMGDVILKDFIVQRNI